MKEFNIFEKILYVGLDYKKPRGGIASVLNTYSSFIHPFKFVRTAASDLTKFQKFKYALSGYVSLIYKLLTDSEIKIVHIHSASGTSFWRKSIVIKLARLFNKKIIFHCHGGGFKNFREKSPSRIDSILKNVDYIVCLSQEWNEYFRNLDYKNVVTIKNVIPEPNLEIMPKDNHIHFLFLGLICDNKGIFDLIKVLSDNREDLEGKMILHIGGNGETDRLSESISELHLEQLVKYEGWVDNNKKQQLLNISDVYILPSYIEGVPISILEAESYKKPVISTNVGGIPSIVKPQESGLLVTPGDSHQIFLAIKTLIENKELRKHYGEEGYKISQKYLPEVIKSELINLYSYILEKQ